MDPKRKIVKPGITRRDMLKLVGAGAGAGVLAACAPKATPTVEAPTQVVVQPTTPPEPKKVTLRYQNHWSKETDAHYKGMLWLYDAFQKKYPYITINNVLNPDSTESYKKITADCAAGDCPDIIHGAGPEMWDAGYLLDLTPYMDAEWLKVLIPELLYKTGDHIWAPSGEVPNLVTIWNTRILTKAGVSAPPTTWEELLVVCDKVKKIGKTPTSWGVGGVAQWHNIVLGQEGGFEAIAANKFDSPQTREAFTKMKVFWDNKWIPDNELEMDWQESISLFVAEETAFYLNGAWTLNNEIRSSGAAPDLRDNVAFVPFPKVGSKGTTVETKRGTPIAIAKKEEKDPDKLDAAIKFLKFWFSEEGGKQWILLTQSPMGVKEDLSKIEGVDPLLIAFLSARDKADYAYSLPSTPAMFQREWDDCWTGLQKILAGGSVDDAMQVYLNEMSKYKA